MPKYTLVTQGTGTAMQYWVDEYPDDMYGPNNKWVSAIKLGYWLNKDLNMTIKEFYLNRFDQEYCPVCGKPTEFRNMSTGFDKTCGNPDCFSTIVSKSSTESITKLWNNEAYADLMSKSMSERTRDPLMVMKTYLGTCYANNIVETQMYIGTSDKWPVKFGLGYADYRLYRNGLSKIWTSDLLPVEVVARLEYDIKIEFPQSDEEYVKYGNSEVRGAELLDSILSFVDKWLEVNV